MTQLTRQIGGMSCTTCAAAVTKALQSVKYLAKTSFLVSLLSMVAGKTSIVVVCLKPMCSKDGKEIFMNLPFLKVKLSSLSIRFGISPIAVWRMAW